MKTFMFTRKSLRELWRSPQLFWLFLLFPTLLVLIYYSAFGQNSGMANYLTILLINNDQGELGAGLVKAIRDAEFDGKPAFTLWEDFSPSQARILLNEGKAALLITIPQQFSAVWQQKLSAPVQIKILGDPLSDTFAFSYSFLRGIIQAYSDQHFGWQQPLPVGLEFLPNSGTLNDFQVGIPGLLIFGIMFGVISNALILTRERSTGTLKRIQLSQANAAQFLGGVTLAGLLLSLLQIVLTLAVAYLLGFVPVGNLLLAVGIGLVTSLAASGAGFIAAAFSTSEGEATAYSTGFMVPLVFLSGAVFPLPVVEWFRVYGQSIQPYDILPATHAARAMSQVILYGTEARGLVYELSMLGLLSVGLLAGGIWLYHHKVLKA